MKKNIFKGFDSLKFYLAAGLIIIVILLSSLSKMRFMGLDMFFAMRGSIQPDTSVVIVEITNSDIDYLGFPFPRAKFSLMHGLLTEAGSRVIGYDMILNAQKFDSLGDSHFAKMNALCANGVHALALEVPKIEDANETDTSHLSWIAARSFHPASGMNGIDFWKATGVNSKPYDELLNSSYGLAHISINNLDDGTFRKTPLFIQYGTHYIPSLGFLMAKELLAREAPDSFALLSKNGRIRVGLPRGAAMKPVDIESDGSILLNYHGKYRTFPHYSFSSIMELYADGKTDTLQKMFGGKAVILGHTSNLVGDYGATPYEPLAPLCITHAVLINNIIQGNYLTSFGPGWYILLVILLFAAVSFLQKNRSVVFIGIGTFCIVLVIFSGAYLLFVYNHIWLQWIPASLGIFVFSVVVQAVKFFRTDREKKKIQGAFNQYVPEAFIKKLMDKPELLNLGGEKEELTVIFSDLAGFTTISEKLTPEETVEILNEYLDEMTLIIMKHNGTLDKYIGDAIMAFWGAPIPLEDHATLACRCVLEMVDRLNVLRKQWSAKGRPDIFARYGINTGHMIVGNIGSSKRFNYTVIGDPVNLGARLEPANKEFGTTVMISEFTLAKLNGDFLFRQLDKIVVKGKKIPVKVYELLADKTQKTDCSREEEIIRLYNYGLEAYYQRQWKEAIGHFSEVLNINSDDGPSLTYISRCNDYIKTPPGEGWDGVYTMTHK